MENYNNNNKIVENQTTLQFENFLDWPTIECLFSKKFRALRLLLIYFLFISIYHSVLFDYHLFSIIMKKIIEVSPSIAVRQQHQRQRCVLTTQTLSAKLMCTSIKKKKTIPSFFFLLTRVGTV